VDGLDRGLAGIQGVEWPYHGPEPWIRLAVLLGAPALLSIGAMLAFWPTRRAAPVLRLAGLVALLLVYGAAVAERDPGRPALRGFALLLLVAAWLWLPRMPRREALVAGAVVAAVGALSLPLAAALDANRAWWDYRGWNLFGSGEVIRFNWNHTYGPLNWSRAGATVLNVKSDRPQYWKAETLDGFDGLRWIHTGEIDDSLYGTQVAYSEPVVEGRWGYGEYNLDWDERIRFTVRSLSTRFVVGAGVILRVDGAPARLTSDGTTRMIGDNRLEEGDSYSVRAYAPNPTKAQMRGAPEGYDESLVRYTSLQLPNPGDSATEDRPGASFVQRQRALERETVYVPLRGNAPSDWGPRAERLIGRSPYAPMYQRARELTDNEPTVYDAVKSVELWLQSNFTYSERVPTHRFPLMAFLEDDKRGYCQQFSGTMALMLRMAGIPARVAGGFAPGSYNKDTREYRVRDLDAHSWVEVWFSGIGWVPFDPTPALAPAQSQSAAAVAPSAARGDASDRLPRQSLDRLLGTRPDASLQAPKEGQGKGTPWGPILLGGSGGVLALTALVVWWRSRRRDRPACLPPCGDADVDWLIRLMARLGLEVRPGTTLFEIENRLATVGGAEAAGYARRVRQRRFAPAGQAAPGREERRRLRRALADGTRASRLARIRLALPDNPLQRTR
jgi:transglutaminase-like putative cysteine protease